MDVLDLSGKIDLQGLKRQATIQMTASAVAAIDGTSTPQVRIVTAIFSICRSSLFISSLCNFSPFSRPFCFVQITNYAKILLATLGHSSANPSTSTIPQDEFPNRYPQLY